MLRLIWLVPMLPLAGAALLGIAGRRLGERAVGVVACGLVAASFVVAAGAAVEYGRERWEPDRYTVYRSDEAGKGFPNAFTWIPGGAAVTADGRPVPGGVTIEWVYAVDALTCVMLLVVTGVGLLIHVFATGYMRGDAGYARFFAYLNLFMFSMLVLVLGANLPMLFVGWEGVGLCSYLLIGFWFERREAADAAKKAFVVNRIGDFGFLLGMFGLFALFGTFDFTALREAFAAVEPEQMGRFGAIGLVALGLFVGATGKSAQIPLFVWLPDAMAGPTPVSALIHAATMVTAGVYMLARLNFVFAASPTTMLVVAVVGGATAVLAAAIAFTQNDIKKVLAYSTVSQLGLMVLACGVGAFAMAIFHVMTHAFFKALLFLGAGSVIHGLHHEQDMRKMGGLRGAMPVTFWTMAVAWLAIAGIFPLAGFFSKDAILWESWISPYGWGKAMWVVGLVVAACTAFYMTRLMMMTFWGEFRGEHAPHESPRVMTVPLVVLAALSVVGGWVGIGAVVPLVGSHEPPFARWLAPVVAVREAHAGEHGLAEEAVLALAALAVAAGAVALGYYFYVVRPELPGRAASALGGLAAASRNKFWFDEAYAVFPVGFTVWLSRLAFRTDSRVVDGAVNGTGWLTRRASLGSGWLDFRIVDGAVHAVSFALYAGSLVLRAAQTGLFQTYALAIVIGLVAFVVVLEWSAIAGVVSRLLGGGQ
jgi:NADH-quinone oxidoreductase subunit L